MAIRKIIFILLAKTLFSQYGYCIGDSEKQSNVLAIVDLVDVFNNQPRPDITFQLRSAFYRISGWSIIPEEKQNRILEKNQNESVSACNDPQCAFELGGLLQASHVLFGTATFYQGYLFFTFKLLNMTKAKVIWTHAVFSLGNFQDAKAVFINVRSNLSDFKPVVNPVKGKKKILALLEYGSSSLESKILNERILTHAYSLEDFDIMSPTELEELISILEIRKPSFEQAGRIIGEMGKKLGVNSILYSNFKFQGERFKLGMALFDIDKKTVPISMPTLVSSTFRDLMIMENNFFIAVSQKLDVLVRKETRGKIFRK